MVYFLKFCMVLSFIGHTEKYQNLYESVKNKVKKKEVRALCIKKED